MSAHNNIIKYKKIEIELTNDNNNDNNNNNNTNNENENGKAGIMMMSDDSKKIMNDETNITADGSSSSGLPSSDGIITIIDVEKALNIDDDDDGKGDDGKCDDNDSDDGANSGQHSKYIWLHAFYHSIVTIIGTGILGFPYAMSYLGWYGASAFITAISAYAYYTAILLINLQEKGQGTYSELTDSIMGVGFSKCTVRPAQLLNFFPTTAVMILIGGQSLATIDALDGVQNVSDEWWLVIDAGIVMALSLLPDLNRAWQVSLIGAFAAFLITGYSIGGSIVALVESTEPIIYDQPLSAQEDPAFDYTLMSSFGSILFGYGFHAVLPDIQASLHDHNTKDSKGDMKKAVTAAFCFSYPAYLLAALIGFAAFGYQVQSELLLSINNVLSKDAMYVIWVFVVIKTSTEAAVYNQAAFTLIRDITGLTLESDHIDHHPRNWIFDFCMRFVYVTAAACIAIFVPFFNDLTAITAAISITPTTCLLPIIMWNKKHGSSAPNWRLYLHYLFLFLSVLTAVVALVGAIAEITFSFESGEY